ncbi:hypothetical protein SAMN02983003_0737 [Devosia enhydra]|uniref:Uncharacterized protein n=1 Tax=Devosia enhydra TaxID=665118 RepID=A0A1K2HU48_9HYPH|nr:hypothetical protein [Devosia enhydra]SFZ81860.1 hypothetical protein SAMN02983003_0737 [Devosia enhydra]
MTLAAGAALLASLLLIGLAGFHAALAMGAPWGAYAWGGQHKGALPQRLQWGSAASVPVVLGMAVVLLIRTGLLHPQLSAAMEWAVWAIFLYLVLNAVANWRSESEQERRVMGPLATGLALLVAIVAFNT